MKKASREEVKFWESEEMKYNYYNRLSPLEIYCSENNPKITHFMMRKITRFGMTEPRKISKKFALKHYEEMTSDGESYKYSFFHVDK